MAEPSDERTHPDSVECTREERVGSTVTVSLLGSGTAKDESVELVLVDGYGERRTTGKLGESKTRGEKA